jgi:hypothetical protein
MIFDDHFDLAVLGLLAYRAVLVHLDDIPSLLKDHAPKSKGAINDGPISNALHRLENNGHYVTSPFTSWYGITEPGRSFYNHQLARLQHPKPATSHSSIIIAGSNNQVHSPGSSLKVTEPEESQATRQLTERTLADLPKAIWYRHWGFVAAVIGIIVTIVVAIKC